MITEEEIQQFIHLYNKISEAVPEFVYKHAKLRNYNKEEIFNSYPIVEYGELYFVYEIELPEKIVAHNVMEVTFAVNHEDLINELQTSS